MKKKCLTSRQKEIIQMLTKSTINTPITVSYIANKLGLSSRTVLREMPKIEKWLDENEFKFIKKPGVGLIIDETLENQQLILELLEIEKVEKEYSKEERQKIILSELLVAKEPLKLFYFTSQLKVSEGTLSNDLDIIEEELNNYHIKLIRKPGLGIYLEGREKDYRRALVNILYDTLDENSIMTLLKESIGIIEEEEKVVQFSIENRLLKFIDKSIIKNIEEVISELEERFNMKLADSAYIGLVVHLSLAIQRIKNNEKITMDEGALNELAMLPEFKVAEEITTRLEKSFNIDIPKDEVGYVTMHLKGAKLRLNRVESEIDMANLDIKQLASYIIKKVQENFTVDIKGDNKLLNDLTNHLGPAISRLTMRLNIRNPLLENIKSNYGEVFQVCKEACEILKDVTKVTEIPESEIAYITMHIAAALEKTFKEETLSVVIACPTGIGTSRLLLARIKKEFNNIDVKGTISAMNINKEKLIEEGIDLIITTVDLDIDYKYVVVNPLLDEQDKLVIKDNLKKINKNKKYKEVINKRKKLNLKQITNITKLGNVIISVIEGIRIKEIEEVNSISKLIENASELFAHNEEYKLEVEENLNKREEIASTYLAGLNIMLLHCKSNFEEKGKFGVIKLEKSFVTNEKKIEGAIVSIIPTLASEEITQVLSEINGALIEQEDFINILKSGNELEIINKIEEILSSYYTKYIRQMEEFRYEG